jgi:uncharacterized protein (TIGR02266 family)
MSTLEQLEVEAAKQEKQLQAEVDQALEKLREQAARLKALKAALEEAATRGADLTSIAPKVQGIALPQLEPGGAVQHAENLRKQAVAARVAAVEDLKKQLPTFVAALSKAQLEISAQQGAMAEQIDRARAVAAQVAAAAKQQTVTTDERTPIGRMKPLRSQRVRMQAKIDFTSENNFFSGFSTNLSDGGVFIATVKQVPIGTHVDLFFRLPTGDGIEAEGVVRWVREVNDAMPENMPGLGVQFVKLPEAAKAAISAFVRDREPMFFPD